jgi:hypothetical protein
VRARRAVTVAMAVMVVGVSFQDAVVVAATLGVIGV